MSVKLKFGPLIQFKYTKALIFFDSHSINHSIDLFTWSSVYT